jgi:uncharacterized protein YmfQ (DUF2313 family)
MARPAEAYLQLLQALLPQGLIWPRDPASTLARLLHAQAEDLARLDQRGGDLLDEADPRTSFELLPDWERVCGLPDICSEVGENLDRRRAAVVAQLTAAAGQSRAYFTALAAAHGYQISIQEFRPFRAGISRAGDPARDSSWMHTWQVSAPETTTFPFKAGSGAAGDRVQSWGNDKLECVIKRAKPAHTNCLFAYGG